ncbi:snoRNA-binding rRNA-processing protein utp10 [Scheffersomyces spartinae]|uniref:U3 small nucleolar RNA-associated protein 10 n=1 Tax=Scheffersomyces spartinae TaxID=45513 RepID=A0A9P7V5L9_9ASCO|nr:snoRNA-binding rRNA-processing protein utp10 [Scheffersomyces spartinae]KAG7191374.1 snoRNA-binding rRNA-processing protein utp10 [Scheffersomyces spartinae]
MSSLALQLNAISSKTASVALDRKSRSRIHSRSLIFDPKVAATQDYETIFDHALEGLEELIDLDPRFKRFKQTLFSESAITLDRNVQQQESIDQLDKNIEAFLNLVGPYFLLSPTLKALEWLVRRFYINIHNPELLLLCSLPYYKYPVFVRVLNIIPKNQFPKLFEWLSGYKDTLKCPPIASIFKAFYNDFQLFKLYSIYVAEQWQHLTAYKELLVFYLSIAVQLIASYAKQLDSFTELHLPILLEAAGKFLLPPTEGSRFSQSLITDARLTSYSLFLVLNSVVPLSSQLIMSITDSVLQSDDSVSTKNSKQTIVFLGQLWNTVSESSGESSFFKKLPPIVLTKNNLIKTLIDEKYTVKKFLTVYTLSKLPEPEAFALLDYVISQDTVSQLTKQLLHFIPEASDDTRSKIIITFEKMLKLDSECLLKALKANNIGLPELEMKLMTTLSSKELEPEPEVLDLLESDGDEDLEAPTENVSSVNLEELKTQTGSFIISSTTEEFKPLVMDLLKQLQNLNLKQQRILISKFSNLVFVDVEAAFSFYLRVVFTPSVPLAVRLSVLRYLRIKLKDISTSKDNIELYLLTPILLLGLYNPVKALRAGMADLLSIVKDNLERLNSTSKSKSSSMRKLFMEEQIYAGIQTNKRAIIPPADALKMLTVLHSDSSLQDVVIDNSRLNSVLFEGLFKATKGGQKKFGQLLLKTFVLNQWALATWSVVFKSPAWKVVSVENCRGGAGDDRFFFMDTDVAEYLNKRDSWQSEATYFGLDFETDVEVPIVNLVGGGSNEKNVKKEVEWLINSLTGDSADLQTLVDQRIIKLFPSLTSTDLKVKLLSNYVECLVNEDYIEFDPIASLQSLDIDHDSMIVLLQSVQIGGQVPDQGVPKRRRKSSNSTKQAMAREDISSMATHHLRKATIILDTLEAILRKENAEVASPELLKALFNILTQLEYLGNDGNLPVLYAQEALASCMLLSIKLMKTSAANSVVFDSNSVRADLIVNSIRTSQSPQVQNRLLLVIAELASLAPEIILHSVMPIFTFMGAHTVRQDDEFSNSALQQTIAKVIPALAANGKSSMSKEIEFLLTSFVAAVQHIPRHRRVKLFTSLVNTLGSENSLHIILFMFGQQYASALQSNKINECKSLVELGTVFLKHFTAVDQLASIEGFYKVWNMLPTTQLDSSSPEYIELATRSIFGVSILSLSDKELAVLKQDLIKYLNKLLESDDSLYNMGDRQALKLKVTVELIDDRTSAEVKQKTLKTIKDITGFILSSLETFNAGGVDDKMVRSLYALLNTILNLLPISYFVESICPSLDIDNMADLLAIKIARNFAILTDKKFDVELNTNTITEEVQTVVIEKLIPVILKGIKKNVDVELDQAYLNTFATIVNKFGICTKELTNPKNSKILIESLSIITSTSGLLSDHPEIVVSSINVISSIVNTLGVKIIGFFPKIVPPALKIWSSTVGSRSKKVTESSSSSESDSESESDSGSAAEDDDVEIEEVVPKQEDQMLQTSIILLFSCLVRKIPSFMNSSLDLIFLATLQSDLVESSIRSSVLDLIIQHMDTGVVLKSLCNIWPKFSEEANAVELGLYLSTMQSTIEVMDKKSCNAHSSLFMKWLIRTFEFRLAHEGEFDNNALHRLENNFATCGINYIMKLNDKSFRPLFANIVRWAVNGEGSTIGLATNELSRMAAFFRFFNKLQEQLRGIITSYYSYLLEAVVSMLNRFSNGEIVDVGLRRLMLISLTSAFKYDQDDYWSQVLRFETISQPLLLQLTNIEEGIGKYLVKCIASFVGNIVSDDYNDQLVHTLIKFVSNDNDALTSNTKIWTIRSLKAIFQKIGDQWLLHLPTFIPYIAELLEDDDEAVELEVRSGLVKVIENVLGEPLDRYLD